jgi:hypothetical protein
MFMMNDQASINLVSLIGKTERMNRKQKGPSCNINKMYFGCLFMLHSSVQVKRNKCVNIIGKQ